MQPSSHLHATHRERGFARTVYQAYRELQRIRRLQTLEIDGSNLTIPAVVAVSQYGVSPRLDDSKETRDGIESSVKTLHTLLDQGKVFYGVKTGFGGSADTRTDQTEDLQAALLQHHQFGVLSKHDIGNGSQLGNDRHASHQMSPEWVKGTMLVRCNTISRGHSAVRLHVIKAILKLLQNDSTPVIPLRGSISASGDLSPLSYVAGAVAGNPDVYIQTPSGTVTATEALEEMQIAPVDLGPKEGLGLMNGTATSAATASLAMYETHHIAIMSQVLTAMATEALGGTIDNYDPFIAHVRPHRGQIESAKTIHQFLQGSQLARGTPHSDNSEQPLIDMLYQDRYALRTASQWMGPQLEDLLLAHEQVATELNSTTDNPLVDVAAQKMHHGGNFQAASVTSAMEKTRLSLQMIGRLMFAQCSELINPMLSNGLPPNLAADEPSTSYTMKGVDIGMASYMSELAFMANPVSSHVQSAEMHNQAVNSLAFISTRYTLQSVELVSLMCASYLYTVCQALDLRVMQKIFFRELELNLLSLHRTVFSPHLSPATIKKLHTRVWSRVQASWLSASSKDTPARVTQVIDNALAILTQFLLLDEHETPLATSVPRVSEIIQTWKSRFHDLLTESHASSRAQFFEHQHTPDSLGQAAKKMYIFVRERLGVPFHRGLEDHPTPQHPVSADGTRKQTIGSYISVIYESLRSGDMHEPLMDCLVQGGLTSVEAEDELSTHGSEKNGVRVNGSMTGPTANCSGSKRKRTGVEDEDARMSSAIKLDTYASALSGSNNKVSV
ncbi:MAG: hypothetical protein Q9203_005112 [Teloschistes exilis]